MSLRKILLGMAIIALMACHSFAQEPAGDVAPQAPLPLSNSPSASTIQPLTFAQQAARFEAEQRLYRIQWNKWIAHDPLRPTMNASYMSNGVNRLYIPSRGIIVSASPVSAWYW